ncbi:MAG: Biotin carboxyl carrier protein of acetyl-CoA carboxylase [Candidatus Anoxychlamydiales bacterium]|nr:Biotin carboxyl carrier protein of acetyl-CoA carboxylase [Candidatus Anoxychlamydiales bacterium]HEU63899.1 acetyl-CoA carboxylase biotin carboxyl carrier protein [Chlamydiota bacterium]
MEINVIKKIIALLEESNLKKIHLRDGDFEISLEKDHSAHKVEHVKGYHGSKEPELERHIEDDNKDYIISPMVGTFYVSSAPDQPPFVKVGDTVNENTVVCVIEAMKVMNEIKAGKKGVIKEVLTENAQAVEYETKLFVIE